MVAGFQVPLMPLVDVVGNAGAGVVFWHTGGICTKAGVAAEITCMTMVAVVAHWPAAGVKV